MPSFAKALVRTPERRLLLTAFLVRIVPAWIVYGADDVQDWIVWGRALLEGANPYASIFPIVWPPLWLPVAAVAVSFSDLTGLPIHVAVKLPAIVADLIITMLLYSIAARYGRRPYALAMAYALNPISIYTTAIHGQFDSLPLLCATVAAFLYAPDLEADRSGIRAGAWLGVGAAFKTWPLLILPALLLPSQSLRRRAVIAGTAVSIWVVGLLAPWPFVGFKAVADAFGYRGMAGWWGLTSLPLLTPLQLPEIWVRWFFYAAMMFATLVIFRYRMPIAAGVVLLLLTVYITTPGGTPHYLIWIVPAALIADPRRSITFAVIAALMLTVEIALRPYNGYFGETVRFLPHAGYARSLGGPLDRMATLIDRLAVWAFCCWWWGETLRDARRLKALWTA
jgi:uncharacterized membrane protein